MKIFTKKNNFLYDLHIYIISPIVLVLLICLKIPRTDELLNQAGLGSFTVYGGFIILTSYTYYASIHTPYKILKGHKEKIWDIMEVVTASILLKTIEDNHLCINIMVPYTSFFYKIEPKDNNKHVTKLTRIGKVFDVIWEYEKSDEKVDKQLKMSTKQGISGKVFRSGKPISAGVTTLSKTTNDFNFTYNQESMVGDLQMLTSVPIFKKKKGFFKRELIVKGVLNVYSKNPDANSLIADRALARDFQELLMKISNIYRDMSY